MLIFFYLEIAYKYRIWNQIFLMNELVKKEKNIRSLDLNKDG